MWSTEIEDILKTTQFLGCFTVDELPPFPKKNTSLTNN